MNNTSNSSLSTSTIPKWASVYKDKPVIRALVAFVTGLDPTGLLSGLDATLVAVIEEKVRERQRAFFDELDNGTHLLTEEMIQQEDFLHAFTISYRAAIRTRNREKIRKFARLLLSAVEKDQLQGSEIEEFVSILDTLSERELQILLLLKKFEDETEPSRATKPPEDGPWPESVNVMASRAVDKASVFWRDFVSAVEHEYGIAPALLKSMLARVERTGLYDVFTGVFFGGDSGSTTQLFAEFTEWLQEAGED